MTSRRKRPSIGFIAVCLTYCLVVVFFLFGFSTPDLDRVWTLHHVLKTGEMTRLEIRDKRLLTDAMYRHKQLTSALLGGDEIGIISAHAEGWVATPCVTVLRTTKSKKFTAISIDVQTPKDLLPFSIVVEGAGWKEKLDVKKHGRYQISIPEITSVPEIIEVKMKGRDFGADPSALGMHLSFKEKQ
ncbi:MAG: hypothetical protein GY854_28505 [Deltaproteobacteria bacterium]|nr:hypothetical protein [Deltaproteobacteria bacterium]